MTDGLQPDYRTGVASWLAGAIVFTNAALLLGVFSRSGSTGFIVGLPIIFFVVARLLVPRLGSRALWATAGAASLLGAFFLLFPTSGHQASRTSGTIAQRPQPRPGSAPASAAAASNPQELHLKAQQLLSAGQQDSAAAVYRQILAANSSDGRAHYQLAVYHAQVKNDSATAMGHLEQARKAFAPDSLWHRRTRQLQTQLKGKTP